MLKQTNKKTTFFQQQSNSEFNSKGNYVYLNKDGAIGIGMRIDRPRGALAADVARERHAHPTPWRFGEE